MLCLPFGPANVLTSAAIGACITCRPAPTARASSPVPITRPRVRARRRVRGGGDRLV
jgi:hypothetical protein